MTMVMMMAMTMMMTMVMTMVVTIMMTTLVTANLEFERPRDHGCTWNASPPAITGCNKTDLLNSATTGSSPTKLVVCAACNYLKPFEFALH